MSQMPLSGKAIMSNSIVCYVLAHPELTDALDAYGKWAREESWRNYAWNDPDITVYCIHLFDFCMNTIDRETLEAVWAEEKRILAENA